MDTLAPAEKPKYYTFEDYPIEDLLVYAGIDCIVTSDIASKMFPDIVYEPDFVDYFPEKRADGKATFVRSKVTKAMSIMDMYLAHVAPAHEFLIDLELNGIKYDVEGNRAMKARMEEEIENLEAEIWELIPGVQFNLDSGTETGKYLYDFLKLTPPSFTKTNEPSTDGDAMKELAKNYPEHSKWLNILAKRNDIASLYRTFIRTYVEDFVKSDGRIHPSYNQHGTSSFRISGSDPNLTQLPRPKHGYNIRELFTVDEGYVFIAFDFSSAEVKILGALCKDEALLRAIREGLDFHAFSASNMFGIEYNAFVAALNDDENPNRKDYKEKRQISKVLTFSILYGSSPAGIAAQLGVTLERAKELMELYFNLFPGVKTYVECSHEMALSNGFVIGPFGQRKMEFGAKSVFKGTAVYNGALRNAQNVRVQNTTSTFGLACFARLNEAIKKYGAMSLCTVYDSIELQVPIKHAAEVLELAFYILNDEPVKIYDWLELPVGVDAEIGFNWGDAVHINRGATQEEIEKLLETLKE